MRSFRRVALSLVGFGLASLMLAQSVMVGTVGVAANPPASPTKARPPRPQTFGTSQVSYYVIDSTEMDPIASVNTYSCFNNCQLRYQTNVTGIGLLAPMHLPAGAIVTYMEIDGYDNSATGELQASFGVCDFAGQNCTFQFGNCTDAPVTLCSGNTATDGFSGWSVNLTPDNIVIDNFLNRYIIAVGNTTNDASTAISQIIVGYMLQVSPAPSSATFADVQPGDFGFQFIEALAASGITGGCGGGNFCPNNNVTRAQMAVFLAKALGLQWQ